MVFVRKELHLFTPSCNKHLLSTYSTPAIVYGAGNTKMKHSLGEVTDMGTDGYNTLADSIYTQTWGRTMKAEGDFL